MYGISKLSHVSLIAILAFVGVATSVSASPMGDFIDGINDGLFGGINDYGAKTLVTAIIIAMVGLAMSYLSRGELPLPVYFIVIFCVLGGLTAIGWADPMFVMVASMIAVGSFVSWMAGFWTRS